MRTIRKTLTAGLAATGLLGLGLYVTVPAFADSPSPSPTAKTERGDDRPHRWGPGWRGRGEDAPGTGPVRGVHGEFTFHDSGKGWRLFAFQHGEITALSPTAVTVRSADGTSWTWTTDDDTGIRKNREHVALKDLAKGDKIRIAGPRSGDTRTAGLIQVRD